ncbi:putative membrane protein YdbT with pleckstrin-like domain [Frigoribacterium sp. PhB160]|uniref:PH domain-containing protein n=1 Tax=Frigoribacterium sp. PhB160 TaxID=2485192 RepID=UPI000F484216|nr:PH domain-containing protein [Frigoribacterium sp. PhB160]ROS58202.1 putative membrane protein YdbT with pleckstrin-like domain [Frigoribacterium sp. PhB160]
MTAAGPGGGDAPPRVPGPTAAPAEVAALTDGEWHRLHPATPLLKGGIALVILLGIVVNNAREFVVGAFVPGERGDGEGDPFGYVLGHGLLLWILLGIVGFVALLVAVFWLSWRMNTFRVTDDTVEVRSGVVFRTNRRARLDRVQGINIQRPVVARVFGAAKLEISQAGDDANVTLAYLRSASADDLRREILRRASGAQRRDDEGPGATHAPSLAKGGFVGVVEQRAQEFLRDGDGPEEAPPASVVKVDVRRLVGSVVLSGFTLFIVAAVVAVIVSVRLTGEFFLLFALLPAALSTGPYYVSRVTKSLRYSIAGTRDGIRIGYGLFSTTNETLPPGRIHSVRVSQPLLWRPFGWWQISINKASRSKAGDAAAQQSGAILLPVGDEGDVRRVLELVLPELVGVGAAEAELAAGAAGAGAGGAGAAGAAGGVDESAPTPERAPEPLVLAKEVGEAADDHASHTLRLVEDGLTSRGADGGFTTSPRRAAVLRWFSWRRNGFRAAPGAVLLRKGAIWRELVIVPLPRVQSVGLHQGPLLRRMRLAAVHLHTVAGPITAHVGALDEHDAMTFFRDTARDAVAAAQADRTHRWLSAAVGDPARASASPAPAADADPHDPTHPHPDGGRP